MSSSTHLTFVVVSSDIHRRHRHRRRRQRLIWRSLSSHLTFVVVSPDIRRRHRRRHRCRCRECDLRRRNWNLREDDEKAMENQPLRSQTIWNNKIKFCLCLFCLLSRSSAVCLLSPSLWDDLRNKKLKFVFVSLVFYPALRLFVSYLLCSETIWNKKLKFVFVSFVFYPALRLFVSYPLCSETIWEIRN